MPPPPMTHLVRLAYRVWGRQVVLKPLFRKLFCDSIGWIITLGIFSTTPAEALRR